MWQEEREVALGLRKVRATQSLQLGGYSIDGWPTADFVWVCRAVAAWWRWRPLSGNKKREAVVTTFPIMFCRNVTKTCQTSKTGYIGS